jgi:hypothetical protein
MEVDNKQRAEGNVNASLTERENILIGMRTHVGVSVVGLGPYAGSKLLTSDSAVCPQCKRQIIISKRPSSLLKLASLIKSSMSNGTKSIGGIAVASAVGASVSITIFCMFVSTGLAIWKAIAPESVIMTILGIKQGSFESALNSNAINLRHLSLLAGFPVFLFSMRCSNVIAQIFELIYPAFFGMTFVMNDFTPPKYIWLFRIGKYFYEGLYKLTFNRVYYRLAKRVAPSFFGLLDSVTAEDIQEDEPSICEINQRVHDEIVGLSWYKRLWYWCFPPHTKEESIIMRRSSSRERKLCWKIDFSYCFNDSSFFWKLITTLLWPTVGNIFGSLLGQFTPINAYLADYVNTPDEGTYARNLVGMALVAVIKDCAKLYLAWTLTRQRLSIDIVDNKLQGTDILNVTDYITSPQEPIENVVELHRLRNLTQGLDSDPGSQPHQPIDFSSLYDSLAVLIRALHIRVLND